MMKRSFLCLVAILLSFSTYAENQPLWQLGTKDGSHAEFALDENNYSDFVNEGFGHADQYFVVGQSDVSKDWPYLLPGTFDEFIGRSFWAGYAMCKLPLYFNLEAVAEEGMAQLVVDFLEVSSEQPPIFRVEINGHHFESQLLAGPAGKTPDQAGIHPQQVVFDIPVSYLKKGINEMIFQNHLGRWSIFDSITFWAPDGTIVRQGGNTLVREVKDAGFCQHGQQPVLVDVLHRGKTVDLEIKADGQRFQKRMEAGRSVWEIALPAVASETISEVQVLKGREILYEGKIVRHPQKEVERVDYVNQFMGTSGSRWMINPGPWMPMSMVKLSPDNEESRWKAGYEYQVENIMGFSHVHEWMMAGLLMMPSNGRLWIHPGPETDPDLGYRSRIDKQTEKAEVGKYSVDLTDTDIHVDLTATKRATMQRYVFPERKDNHVLIDLHFPSEYIWELHDAVIRKVSDQELEGYALSYCDETGYSGENLYKLHFVIQFDQPMLSMGGWVRDRVIKDTDCIDKYSYEPEWSFYLDEYKMNDAGAFVYFPEEVGEVKVRTGISLVSTEQARLNLTEEVVKPFGWDFEAVVKHQRQVWEELLGRIEIETDDYLEKVKFYSNLYHTLSGRSTWSDVNGKWVDMDENVQQADPSRPVYGSDGYWGAHWNLFQFYNLVAPEVSSNWIYSFSQIYQKGGWLPIGNPGHEYVRVMIGCPALPLIVSAWQHGIRDFDKNLMYDAMYHQLTSLMEDYPGGGQVGMESNDYYLERGYVPLDAGFQSYVSNTMEYAYQDWCFAQYCKSIGGHDSVYQEFMRRSENWKNLFDQESGFIRPRKKDGSWLEDFNPFTSPGFVESNSWQYTWYVPHDLPGLVQLMGRDRFVKVLDGGMETSQKVNFNALGDNFLKYPINHGNQSNMQSCYLFNYAGAPWLTQKWTRAIQEKYYGLGPRDAYPGDEDQGQMSAWYVMSAMGLFQMDGGCAAQPTYDLGSPRFEKVTIHLSPKYYGGKTFVIKANGASRNNCYIRSVRLNGKKYTSWKIPAELVLQGGELELEMTNKPTRWGRP